jgi:anti-sigma regulatory factor (Ser/Thr protein kinase)
VGTRPGVWPARIHGRFEPTAANVVRARMLVRSAHADLPPGMLERLELVVSELASNAVIHAETRFDVRLTIGEPIRVEVIDGSPIPPVVRHPVRLDLGGRGLIIVDAAADRWGFDLVDDGKVVWAELDDDPETEAGT